MYLASDDSWSLYRRAIRTTPSYAWEMQADLFQTPDTPPATEISETLASLAGARIERIVSWGHASPDGFWYDQDEDEWVAVLAGQARLRLEDPTESVELSAGEHLVIAAHRRHRVEWTLPEKPTVWLAVFSASAASTETPR